MIRSLLAQVDLLWQDSRYGARLLLRRPAFTFIVVAVLALGTGANVTVFTWIDGTLLNPVPGSAGTRGLVAFARPEGMSAASYPDFQDLRVRLRSFSELLSYQDNWTALTGTGAPERVYAAVTTANYFDLLQARPVLGRAFLPEEERSIDGAPVAVISHRLWRERFGGQRSVLGRTIEVNRRTYGIVGVAPPAFQGAKTALRVDVWLPISMSEAMTGEDQLTYRGNTWFNVIGRLRPGVTRAQAQAELDDAMRRLAAEDPETHDATRVTLHPLWSSPIGANGFFAVLLPLLMAAAGAVLVLTCANVTNLVLVRWLGRGRELAVRASIGASRGRIRRQLLAESVVLALVAGVAGLLLASWTADSFGAFMPRINIPFGLDLDVGRPGVLLGTFALSLLAGGAVGLLPALRAADVSPATLLRQQAANVHGGGARSRLVSAFVVAQVTVSVVLLCAAGLLVRSVYNARTIDPGFDAQGVLLATYDLLPADYTDEEGLRFDHALLERIRALPGVESVTLTDWVPLTFNRHSSRVEPDGYVARRDESLSIGRANVGPDYFRTMRIPLAAGRDFSVQDDADAPSVAVVNEAFAARYWPGQSALGRQLRAHGRSWTVVGVARNSKYQTVQESASPFLYLPLLQHYYHEATLHVRVTGEPTALASAVVRTIHEQDAHLPVYQVVSLAEQATAASALSRLAAAIIGVFGALALLLATLGVYGVLANVTRQRTREVGIRLALGAAPGGVLRLVLGHGMRLTGIGLLVGLPLALAVTRLLRSQLIGVSATDPLTFLAATALLGVVAFIACYIPARRAARLDPLRALHCD